MSAKTSLDYTRLGRVLVNGPLNLLNMSSANPTQLVLSFFLFFFLSFFLSFFFFFFGSLYSTNNK